MAALLIQRIQENLGNSGRAWALSNCRDRVACAQMLDSTKESYLADKRWDCARDLVLKPAKESFLDSTGRRQATDHSSMTTPRPRASGKDETGLGGAEEVVVGR